MGAFQRKAAVHRTTLIFGKQIICLLHGLKLLIFKKIIDMIGVIPNPKKSFDLDFSSQDVFEKTKYLSLLTKYKFNSRNDILKTYRFEAAEFLSIYTLTPHSFI